MGLLGDDAQVEAGFSPFGDSANLDARRFLFCAEDTIGPKIVWTHSIELLGDVGHVESLYDPLEIVLVSVQDRGTVCAKRTICREIILDAPDGTPR
jgi:hypothetical protein